MRGDEDLANLPAPTRTLLSLQEVEVSQWFYWEAEARQWMGKL
jgi:hypothetical protein